MVAPHMRRAMVAASGARPEVPAENYASKQLFAAVQYYLKSWNIAQTGR